MLHKRTLLRLLTGACMTVGALWLPAVAEAGLLPLPDDPYMPQLPVAQGPYPNATPVVSNNAVSSDSPSVYLSAPFVEQNNPFTFGQVPSWTVGGQVLSYDSSSKPWQIYRYNLDGSDPVCLTCNQPNNDGNNGFSQERPQGDWILFQTQRGRKITLGKPGGGGFGSQLWVMRPDGSDPVALTGQGGTTQELTDDFHAFWSPDGSHVAWVHVSLNAGVDGQNGHLTSTVREADFVDDGGTPRLQNIVNVLPAGSGCEVEHWAPNGSGVLAACPKNGGANLQVYFIRMFGDGATPMAPRVQLITSDDYPSWNENAAFTPDMKAVIYTSSRNCGSNCLMNSASEIADAIGIPQLPIDDKVVLILFLIAGQQGISAGGVNVPLNQVGGAFTTEMYLRDLYTGEVRRLTYDNGVNTQFNWDFAGENLIWTMHTGTKSTNEVTQTKVAHFVLP